MATIKRNFFGKLKTGEEVFAYSLKNDELEVEILEYGGIIRKVLAKDRKGNVENVVLNFETLQEYEDNPDYHIGGIVGRNAGRIANGKLNIQGKIYELELNNNGNNLHGYPDYFVTKLWRGATIIQGETLKLILTRTSPHMEGNFPGKIDFKVIYTLEKNRLTVEYKGLPDRETYMNLANHTYFNLSGDVKEDIGNQKIQLYCDDYIEVDRKTLPQKISNVDFKIFDLRNGVKFKEILNSQDEQIKIVNGGLDHPFILSKKEKIDGIVLDEKSGRALKIKTNQPVVIVYTGNYLEDIFGRNHIGFCLEMQDYPDVLQFYNEKSNLYSKEYEYYSKSQYTFFNF